jgi:hypothetical protein
MTWAQSLNGRAIELVHPRAEQVDFKEIADELAGVYRWCGGSYYDISVAYHTLIVCDAAPDAAKPYALLHDAHESRIGDITRPAQQMLQSIATELFGDNAYHMQRKIIVEAKRRHDRVIYRAAGLPFPSPEILAAVKLADDTAMVTERRDFLLPCDQPWDRNLEAIAPLPRTYKAPKSKWEPAEELYRRFKQYLPVLQQNAA